MKFYLIYQKKKIIVYFGLITTAIALLQIRKLKHLD